MPQQSGLTPSVASIEVLALFDNLPDLDPAELCRAVSLLELPAQPCTADALTVAADALGQPTTHATLQINDLPVTLALVNEPLPETTARRTIGVSYWPTPVKAALGWHSGYVHCACAGEAPPMERAIAAYKVAMALVEQGASGVVSVQAWTCFPANVFRTFQHDYVWPRLRGEGVPAELLTGFLKTRVGDQLWFLSRGHCLFGLPELAFAAQSHTEADSIRTLFHNLFAYMYGRQEAIEPGQTMTLEGGLFLRVVSPSAEQTFLESPTGTFIIA